MNRRENIPQTIVASIHEGRIGEAFTVFRLGLEAKTIPRKKIRAILAELNRFEASSEQEAVTKENFREKIDYALENAQAVIEHLEAAAAASDVETREEQITWARVILLKYLHENMLDIDDLRDIAKVFEKLKPSFNENKEEMGRGVREIKIIKDALKRSLEEMEAPAQE